MAAVFWDSDTGTLTITATANGAPVNLAATTARHVIIKNRTTGAVTELTIASADLPNGKVTTTVTALPVAKYHAILRVTDATGTTTYPSADAGVAHFEVVADMDAV